MTYGEYVKRWHGLSSWTTGVLCQDFKCSIKQLETFELAKIFKAGYGGGCAWREMRRFHRDNELHGAVALGKKRRKS